LTVSELDARLRLQLASQSDVKRALLDSAKRDEVDTVPWDVQDVGIIAPDFVEFLAAFAAMMIAFAILLVLGQWWAK